MKRKVILALAAGGLLSALYAEDSIMQTPSTSKQAVLIIAHQGFRDEEFQGPRDALASHGVKIRVASSSAGPARGALGLTVKPDLLVKDVRGGDYDAVIFVGGPGAEEYFDDPEAHRIAREALAQNRLLCAICIAPATLAKAGVLKGRKATCFPSEEATLRAGGAIVQKAPVVSDGGILTASGPQAATAFGQAIVKALALP